MKSLRNHLLKMIFAMLFVGVAGIQFQVSAQPPRQISYQGKIEMDGDVALAGEIHAAFYLVAEENARVDDDGTGALWWEEHPRLVLSDGNFDVVLGEINEFPDGANGSPSSVFATHSELFFGMKTRVLNEFGVQEWKDVGGPMRVDGQQGVPNENGWVDVSGPGKRDKLSSTPYAIAASEAKDFVARGNTQVDGLLEAEGDTTLHGLDVHGNEAVFYSNATFRDEGEPALRVDAGPDGAILTVGGGSIHSNQSLQIQTNSGQQTTFGGDVSINGNFSIVGTVLGWIEEAWNGNVEVIWDSSRGSGNQIELVSAHLVQPLGPADRSACFLTRIRPLDLEERVDGRRVGDDSVECRIFVNDAGWWQLQAYYRDAGIQCTARCIRW